MDVRAMAGERLIGVSTRLLAAASVLMVAGLALVTWSTWQQMGVSIGPDGTAAEADVPFGDLVTMMVFESSYRPTGAQLLVASALLAGSVVALHRHPSWEQARRLRWEVLGAGLLVLLVVVGLVLANVYVLTMPQGAAGDSTDWIGPQPVTEVVVANLMSLGASLLVMTGATLWWCRLAPAPDADPPESAEQEPVTDDPAPDGAPRAAAVTSPTSDGVEDGPGEHVDYSREWSPEDFRRPS